MLTSLISFLAILNPFSLCQYLSQMAEQLDVCVFIGIVVRAMIISFAAFVFFALTGERFLIRLLSVCPEALRVFGGIIFLIVGYNYATKGYRATELLRGPVEDLPSAVALPFMIRAGTITEAILLGKQHRPAAAAIILGSGLGVSFVVLSVFRLLQQAMTGLCETVFFRYINILARINGLIIGALSVEMMESGIHQLWNVE